MRTKPIESAICLLKQLVYGKKGEPYLFDGQRLRFTSGSRPVRTKYKNSTNVNVRYDALQVELVQKVVKAGDSVIDIGAHKGQYSVLMSARSGPTGEVIAFEPDPLAAVGFKENFALNPTLKAPTLVDAACSDVNGTIAFYTQGGNSQSSFAESALPSGRQTEQIIVKTIRLDDWWEGNREGAPSFIKIDTEGAEINVLRGMPRLLQSSASIVCELHPFAWDEMGVSLEDLNDILWKCGRQMRWLDGSGAISAPVSYGTAIFERL
jgi:FkbM family methyltransferase